MFQKGSRPQNGADPFKDDQKRDTRPFSVLLQNHAQSQALQTSILRILASFICNSHTWTLDVIPEIIEALLGSTAIWHIQQHRNGKGRGETSSTSPLVERLDFVKRLFQAQNRPCLPNSVFTTLFKRILVLLAACVTSTHSDGGQYGAEDLYSVLLETLCIILSQDWLTANVTAISLMKSFVSENTAEIGSLLTDRSNHHQKDAEMGIETCTPLQGCCIVLLSTRSHENLSEFVDVRNMYRDGKLRMMCGLLSKDDKDKLQRWIETLKSPITVVEGVKETNGAIQNAVKHISAVLSLEKSRKRKVAEVEGVQDRDGRDEARDCFTTPLSKKEETIDRIIRQCYNDTSGSWRQQGWQSYLQDKLIGYRKVKDLHAIGQLICLCSRLNEDDESPASCCTICNPPVSSSASVRRNLPNDYLETMGSLVKSGFVLTSNKLRTALSSTLTIVLNHSEPRMADLAVYSDIGSKAISYLETSSRTGRLAAG